MIIPDTHILTASYLSTAGVAYLLTSDFIPDLLSSVAVGSLQLNDAVYYWSSLDFDTVTISIYFSDYILLYSIKLLSFLVTLKLSLVMYPYLNFPIFIYSFSEVSLLY